MRPSLYKPEYVQQLLDYFSEEPYTEGIKKIVTKQGDIVEVPYDKASDFKSLAGFANRLGVHRETLLNWAKEHAEFFDAIKRAKSYQEEWLSVNAHKSLVNTTFAIFAAKNVIDWVDKVETKNEHNVTPISVEFAPIEKKS